VISSGTLHSAIEYGLGYLYLFYTLVVVVVVVVVGVFRDYGSAVFGEFVIRHRLHLDP